MSTATITQQLTEVTLRTATTQTPDGLDNLLRELNLSTPFPYFEDADVLRRPLDIGRAYFADILARLTQTDHENAFKAMQWPNNLSNGDLTAVLPKLVHGTDNENVDKLASDLVNRFPQCALFIRPFHMDGEVQLRVFFQRTTLARLILPYVIDRGSTYGTNTSLGRKASGRKKVVVEFSSPNIANDFEAKHLRGTILGAQISRMYEAMGWDVVRLNYLGDWGKPIALLGIGWARFGKDEDFEQRPIRHILEVKHRIDALFDREVAESRKARDEKRLDDQAKIESEGLFAERNAYFKKLEEGDATALAFWQRIRDASVNNYTKLYKRMNVTFDEYSGESSVKTEAMAELEAILMSRGIAEEKAGAIVIDLKKKAGMKAGMAIVRDRAGSTTYLLRDLAAAVERYRKYEFDEMLYIVATDHNDHFIRMKRILELMDMPDLAGKLRHISFSKISSLTEELNGANTLRSILDRCKSAVRMSLDYHSEQAKVLGTMDESVTTLTTNALLAEEAHLRRATDDAFDQSRLTSFEEGSVLHLQYMQARLQSHLAGGSGFDDLSEDDYASLQDPDQESLLRLLIMWPDVSHAAFVSLEPTVIVQYFSTLTSYLSARLEDDTAFSKAETTVYEAVKIVLSSGMGLLGMKSV